MAYFHRICLALILIFCLIYEGQCARVKLFLRKKALDKLESKLQKQQEQLSNGCMDYQVVDKSNLSFPQGYGDVNKPWDASHVTVICSAYVTQGINELLKREVAGLNGDTIADVMRKFRETAQKCLSFPFGGSVRDQFLGKQASDVDMELSCSVEDILSICENKWTTSKCRGGRIVHIGDQGDDVDAADWTKNFFGPTTNLEFTANALAYDSNPGSTGAVFDLATYGVHDICNRHIRIAAPWSELNEWKMNNKDVFRFWKLRAKEFTALNSDTQNYFINQAKFEIQNADSTLFQKSYCKLAFGGSLAGTTCTVTDCNAAKSSSSMYNQKFAEDFGDFWTQTAKPIIDSSVILSCPTTNSDSSGGSNGINGRLIVILVCILLLVCILAGRFIYSKSCLAQKKTTLANNTI